MINQAEFVRIVEEIQRGETTAPADVEALVMALAEIDRDLTLSSAVIGLLLETTPKLLSDLASNCADVIGIRDHAKRRRLASMAGEAAARLHTTVRLFVADQIVGYTQDEAEGDETEEESK